MEPISVGHHLRQADRKSKELTDVVLIYLGRAEDKYGEDSSEYCELDDVHLLLLEVRRQIELAWAAREQELSELLANTKALNEGGE